MLHALYSIVLFTDAVSCFFLFYVFLILLLISAFLLPTIFQTERGPKLKERSNTRNSILDQYGKVLPRVQRKLAMERAKPYQHPPTIRREGGVDLDFNYFINGQNVYTTSADNVILFPTFFLVSRPQPLSTISKRSANEKVMSRAGFINSVLNKIEEVWLGKGATPQSSPSTRCVCVNYCH